jgi:hypothetical protein
LIKAPLAPYLSSLLISNLTYLAENSSDATYQLTSSEQFVSFGWDTIGRILCSIYSVSPEKFGSKNVVREFSALASWTAQSKSTPKFAQDDPLPQVDVIQELYLRIELLQTIVRLVDFASNAKGISVPKETLAQIKSSAKEGGRAINESATKWKQKLIGLGSGPISQMLKAGVTGEDVSDIIDLGDIEKLVSSREILNVALDTVEGLEKVKV